MEPYQDNEPPHVDWTKMPDLILGNIYTFLGWKDRVNMSLVCHKWEKGYSWPSLWKTFTFDLNEWHLSMDTCPVLEYPVEKYSKMFKHVKIRYGVFYCRHFKDVWCNRFMKFLETLTRTSELVSIEFVNLKNPLRQTDEPTYSELCRAIVNFLESQHKLRRAEFVGCLFRFPEGVEVLRKLIEKSGESLRHLKLLKFVKYARNEHRKTNFEPNLLTLSGLPNLVTFDTDYSLIFVNMVSQAVKDPRTPALSKMKLVYNDFLIQDMYGIIDSEGFRGLRSSDWQFLTKKSPNLQVELIFDYYSMSEEVVEFFIVPNMPITRLEYSHRNMSVELDAGKLFDRLRACQVNDHLEYLHLMRFFPDQDLVSPFSSFLPTCTKLKSLEIWVNISKSVTDLMEYWWNHKPEYLEEVIIRIWNIRNYVHHRLIRDITSKYLPQLRSIGLNVKVDFDL